MPDATTIDDIRSTARRVVEAQRRWTGAKVPAVIADLAQTFGLDFRTLEALWANRERKTTPPGFETTLEHLDEWLEERSLQERDLLERTAQTLEKRGSRAAWVARKAARLAGGDED